MEILTAQQMRRVDHRAVETFGVPEAVLMENAALRVLEVLKQEYGDLGARHLLLLCGKGNNGGDALALARHLHGQKIGFDIVLFGRSKEVRGSAGANLDALRRRGVIPQEVVDREGWSRCLPLLGRAGLIVDGILGTGLDRPVRGLLAHVFKDVRESGKDVVAIDIPSGLSGDTHEVPGPCLRAAHTVTFVRPKIAHVLPPAETFAGIVHVADISIPDAAVLAEKPDLFLIEGPELAAAVPPRRPDSHKGDYGHVLVVAGSRGKGGAARMAALGALRAGCGLVTAAVPAGLLPGFVSRAMEAMTEPLPETGAGAVGARALPRLLAALEGKDAVALGPGLGTAPETGKVVRALVRRARVPLVLDADGLNAFAGAARLLSGRGRPLVLTPHPGEMARLLGVRTAAVQSSRLALARGFAVDHACHLVLKGHRTIVAHPDGTVHVNPTGNPGLAKGGSGDVLTGILAGLLAQGIKVDIAVRLGVYLHGLAADLAVAEVGEMSLLARDVLAFFPKALARIRPPRDVEQRIRRMG